MVKFSNKAKAKPSKRRNFKTKFKIERKVKQHKKNMKKEAQRLKGTGLRHKRQSKSQFLPNLFPFKQQILQEIRKTLPKESVTAISQLNTAEFGLINLENKPLYFPRPKENLIKKYVSNLEKVNAFCNVVLEVVDARNPLLCRSINFEKQCDQNKVKRILVITKCDTIKATHLLKFEKELTNEVFVKYSNDSKQKGECLSQILATIKSEMKEEQAKVYVAGKANTGKHTLINALAKHSGKYQESPCDLFNLQLSQQIQLLDSPYLISDETQFPLFHAPNPLIEPSLQAQEENILKLLFIGGDPTYKLQILKRNDVIVHYQIQDYSSVDDLLKKIGKAQRMFGKGGMVDCLKVRQKILGEWYTGRLNNYLSDALDFNLFA